MQMRKRKYPYPKVFQPIWWSGETNSLPSPLCVPVAAFPRWHLILNCHLICPVNQVRMVGFRLINRLQDVLLAPSYSESQAIFLWPDRPLPAAPIGCLTAVLVVVSNTSQTVFSENYFKEWLQGRDTGCENDDVGFDTIRKEHGG